MDRVFRELAVGVSEFHKTLLERGLEAGFAEELTRAMLREVAELVKSMVMRALEERGHGQGT